MPNKYLDSVQLGRLVTKIKDLVSTSISAAISGSITTLIDQKCAQAKAEALLAAHPVGSYYWSDDSTSPATLFGGTWQALPAGYTLIAQGSGTDSFGNFTYTAGQTYGERMHTLTVGELPAHNHLTANKRTNISIVATGDTNVLCNRYNASASLTDEPGTGFIFNRGNSDAHNNLPPVKAAYAWKRTA